MYKLGWSQFLPFIVTVVGVVVTDLLQGILMGVCVAVVVILKRSFKNSHFLHLENSDGNQHVKMTLAEEVYFVNKGAILKELNKINDGADVTIDMSKSVSVDHDVREIIDNFKEAAKNKNVTVNIIHKKESAIERKLALHV